ncbi:MAG: hypothetical protein O4861_02890 [Trichodesmium sp. St16_bin4-tuft]|nr:hypothetical protein [Trichodesmium sp. MAG_R01]MDE5069196.1 hypothetical protein [Trichodesmium sp. St4_bin8_1]MDE5072437.1 hypothetical protein [Trichodesmium sp. St5_bin8]MDE5077299.1 hypothetical protein [Trichodesmium sp. St2_bin6]MDE5097334.1 hypothetical protein [Trichodesmium sp. St16_bin4-tuft]MDE5104226.1 hypothetical protein [Trichodesmium sp. St19_bin2]
MSFRKQIIRAIAKGKKVFLLVVSFSYHLEVPLLLKHPRTFSVDQLIEAWRISYCLSFNSVVISQKSS